MMTPKSTEHAKFYSFKRQSSFGIRKFTIGVVSVSLGTALVATAPAASADTLDPASSALAAPSTEVTNQTADKAALAQALSDAQAIDLSQQAPEVAEGFVELFARATALLEQTGAAQAELDALTQELQQATVALTAELPTAVGTPVEVVEADTELPAVSEEDALETSVSSDTLEEAPTQFSQQATKEKVDQLVSNGSIPAPQFIDASYPPFPFLRTNSLLTSVGVEPNLADIFAPLYPEGTRFEWFGEYDIDVDASMPALSTGNFSKPYSRNNLIPSVRYVAILPDGTRLGRLFRLAQVTASKQLEVEVNAEPDAKSVISGYVDWSAMRYRGVETLNNASYEWTVKPDTTSAGPKTGVITVHSEGVSTEYWVTVTVVDNRKASDIHVPTIVEQRVAIGASVDPRQVISNLNELPATIGVEWVTQPVTTLAQWEQNRWKETPTYELKVTYPDGSYETLWVPVRIWAQADEMMYSGSMPLPNFTTRTTLGILPPIEKFFGYETPIVPNGKFAGTRLEWGSRPTVDASETVLPDPSHPDYAVRLMTLGIQRFGVRLIFTDGSSLSYVTNPIRIDYVDNATYFTPITSVQEVAFGAIVDPALSIANRADLPVETSYRWKGLVSTGLAGEVNAVVVVTYPDKSSEEVTVVVRVLANQASLYTPTAVLGGLTLGINDPIDPAQLIGNRADLPSDARFEFVEPVGDPLSGTSKIVSVRITFSDGSVKTVRSRLKFRATQAQESIPEIQSLRVSQGSSIRPIDFIKNASSLPVNTRYSWSQEPSTRVPGGRVGQILVTYPDGSTEIITVRFTVG